jgi:phage repressor protein C with HTH and peptisase S24 domain
MEIIQKNLTSINKKSKGHIKPIDLNSAQSSALSPQSLNPNPTKFEQACVELLREGYLVKFRAPGDSMYPTICDGDLITVEPIKPSDQSNAYPQAWRRKFAMRS